MPTDRYNGNNGRPLMPTLATTRTVKSPITPRLAASATISTGSQSGRNDRSDTRNNTKASREDLSTPVKAFLNDNVTPRSSSRKSRVGTSSGQSTPNATPTSTPCNPRPTSSFEFVPTKDQGHGSGGLGISSYNGAPISGRPKSVVSGVGNHTGLAARPPMSHTYSNTASDAGGTRENSSMFFHASDAKSQHTVPQPKKAPTFFYADGEQNDSPPRSAGMPSPPLSYIERSRPQSTFFHADGQVEGKLGSPLLTPPPVTTSPEPMILANKKGPSLRPPSPAKDNIHLSYRKGASQVIRPALHTRQSGLSILPGNSYSSTSQPAVPDNNHDRKNQRQFSVGSTLNRLGGHAKSASLSSIDSPPPVKKHHVEALSPVPGSRVVSNGSLPGSTASAPTPPRDDLLLPQSPTKSVSGQSALQQMNELAANARRERKVLDLEISNSSLLAINRQLEREVRKQKAELRRYRRLSRAGRFSSSTMHSMDELSTVEGSELGDESGLLSDDQEASESGKDDIEDYISESSTDDSALSPDALADRDASYRLKDEKRLQLDLSKHRELLVDSQKMNQSLKRCLGWTEELINEGKKALAYNVRVSDVQLGGRVLEHADDHDEKEDERQGGTLLSAWTSPGRTSLGSERTDRDSGIEVEGPRLSFPSNTSEVLPEPGSETGAVGSHSRRPQPTDVLGETY